MSSRKLLLVPLVLLLVGCEGRNPAPQAPSTQAAGTAPAPPRRAQQPKCVEPPAGLTSDAYFELGEISSGDSVYIKGMLMETLPFDENGATLGLLSIECPRLDEPLGPEARSFAQEFLSSRQAWLDTPWTGKVDPAHGYAYVYRCPDGAFLNAELVRRGYARVKDVGNPEKIAMLRRLEEEARAAKVGIWR